MAKLRHFAICVSDLEQSARFYEEVFGLSRVGREDLEMGSGIYLSDGVVNLALLSYRENGREAAGEAGKGFVGPHHFGFIVEDLDVARERIEAAGGVFHFKLGDDEAGKNFELKFKDPDGIIFDISKRGWVGSSE